MRQIFFGIQYDHDDAQYLTFHLKLENFHSCHQRLHLFITSHDIMHTRNTWCLLKIIHSGYKPSLSEAKECKLIANDIMWKLFKMEGIDYQSYYDTIYK